MNCLLLYMHTVLLCNCSLKMSSEVEYTVIYQALPRYIFPISYQIHWILLQLLNLFHFIYRQCVKPVSNSLQWLAALIIHIAFIFVRVKWSFYANRIYHWFKCLEAILQHGTTRVQPLENEVISCQCVKCLFNGYILAKWDIPLGKVAEVEKVLSAKQTK